MTRVVADTNVFVSALLFGGLPGRFLDLALAESFTLIISTALLEELAETLVQKFHVDPIDVVAVHAKLTSIAEVVEPQVGELLDRCRSILRLRRSTRIA